MMNFLLDLLFPKYCLSCNREGEYWCAQCRTKPLTSWNGRLDFLGEKYFDDIICVADYEDEIINALIKACKYRFVKEISGILAEILCKKLKAFPVRGALVPVPLSARRARWRGFNQAELIARDVAENLNVDFLPCLKRIRNKKAQAKLTEKERLENMKNCFAVAGTVPKIVILIDDVITTGATINECARVLREAGAERIIIAAVAKG